MIDLIKIIDKEISKKYSTEILNEINKSSDYFLKFSILRFHLINDKSHILKFLKEVEKLDLKYKDLKKNDYGLRKRKELYELINTYLGVGEEEKKNFGEVFTPFKLIEEMLDTLPKDVWTNPNLKWFDPASGIGNFQVIILSRLMKGLEKFEPNHKKRYKYIMENMIYTCDISSKNMFLYCNIFDEPNEYKLNHYRGSFLDKGFDNHMKNVWKIDKFDISTSNPPYNQTIDLKFLTKNYKVSEKLLYVHPSSWLIDEKNKQQKFIKAKELIKDDLVSVKMFNGNGVFGIGLFVPCVITYIDKKYNGKIKLIDKISNIEFEYNNINEINKFNTDEYFSIKEKFINYNNHISSNISWEYDNWVILAQIRGHVEERKDKTGMLKDDFYTLVTKKQTVVNSMKGNTVKNQFSFPTIKEAENFLNYIKTKFVRFALSIYKNNANCHRGEINLIPWLDFKQEWDDKKLKQHFNITDNEWDFIESVIPDYY